GVSKVVTIVARSSQRLAKPVHSFVGFPLFEQVNPDIIVGVTQPGIDANGPLAFQNGLIPAILHAKCPSQKGMGLSGGMYLDRLAIQLHSLIQQTVHLRLISLLKQDFSALEL